MNLLLDTNVTLWALGNTHRLSEACRASILTATTVYVSAVTAWEIALKQRIDKLRAPSNWADAVERTGLRKLAITFEHARFAGDLPLHHKDPFDRMLVAQAQHEHLVLVTSDVGLSAYDVPLLLNR